MKIAFLYNRAEEDPAGFAEDDDPARSPVVASIRRLGHEVAPIACTLDLDDLRRRLSQIRSDVAFNRVESLGGSDPMAAAVPMLLDTLGLPYTGCHSESLAATASKLSVKKRLSERGLPTPEWLAEGDKIQETSAPVERTRYIVKSIFEHASFEMDDSAIVGPADAHEIAAIVRERSESTGKPFFAERYIDGVCCFA